MKLSEAMRKGCDVYPEKCELQLTNGRSACALGAVLGGLYGLGPHPGDDDDERLEHLRQMYPVLELVVEPPVRMVKGRELLKVIWSLNDSSGWTREKIADWLEAQGL